MTRSRFLYLSLAAMCSLTATISLVKAQSPQPIVVEAATNTGSVPKAGPATTTTTTAQSAVLAQNAAAIQVAIQTLERIKSGNDEVLKRQEATLQQLEQMQQAAEELKVFSKRG